MDRDELTEKIIGCAYAVHGELGAGFLEKVYENALVLELVRQGLRAEQQVPIPVYFRGDRVGEYFADVLVGREVICELKACEGISREHETQLVNYLTATGLDVGLILNFGRSVSIKRKFRIYRDAKSGQGSNPVNPEKSC